MRSPDTDGNITLQTRPMIGGSVVGLSSLRQHQPKSTEPSAKAKELQTYLSKYSGEKAGNSNKQKKKKKKTGRPQPGGVRIFEEDNTGFRKSDAPAELDAEDEGQSNARLLSQAAFKLIRHSLPVT